MKANGNGILIVEDEPLVRALLRTVLMQAGFDQITAAESIREGTDALGKAPFDLLISDLSLPDGDGVAFSIEVLKQRPSLRLVLITGHSVRHVTVPPELTSRVFLLEKPFTMECALDLISSLLRE